jgi:hypothetical protein
MRTPQKKATKRKKTKTKNNKTSQGLSNNLAKTWQIA